MTQLDLLTAVVEPEPPLVSRLRRAEERQRLCDKMAALFRSRPLEPIDVADQAAIGGMSGYRTRVSDCRRYFGMDIRPEQPRARWPSGRARPRAIYYPAAPHTRRTA